MKIDLCRHLNTRITQEGFLVETPFCYYDHDHVIVYAKRNQDGTYLLTENGEAAERLSFDGVEVDSERITRWLHEMTVSLNVSWNHNDQSIEVLCSESDVSLAVFRIAEAAVQVRTHCDSGTTIRVFLQDRDASDPERGGNRVRGGRGLQPEDQ